MKLPSSPLPAAVATAALCLLSVTGCSSSTEEAEQSPPPSAGPQGRVMAVPDLAEGWQGVLKDVKIDECPLEPGEVTAKGTVKNTAKDSRDIVLVVAWNEPDSTNPALQLTVTKKGVGAGEKVSWSATGKLPTEAGQCVVLARSGSLTKS